MARDKGDVQQEAKDAFAANRHWGLIAMCTGSGKSKIGVDETLEVVKLKKTAKVILAVPTKKLRDRNWPAEFKKWGATRIFNKHVTRSCYVSLNKIEGEEVDLLILDEGHNITPLSAEFFQNNTVHRCLVLTATPPNPMGSDNDKEKVEIFKRLGIPTVFHYPLDQGVREGVVADYEINVVECYLDDSDKYIQAGTQTKPFYQTEYAAYTYLSGLIKRMMYSGNKAVKFKILERMHFIKRLRSKEQMARFMLDYIIPREQRYIIFCGSIAQANALMGRDVFHSEVTDEAMVKFCNGEMEWLGVVNAFDEGHNVENVDGALICQLNSQERTLTQRIGRTIRLRAGHKAKIWILVTKGTVDENWFLKAVEGFDPTKIIYHHYKNLMNRKAA